MTITKSASRGQLTTLQNAGAATANGVVIAIPDSFKHHTIMITGSAGVASGAVQVEASDTYDYAGTWAPIGGNSITVVASSSLAIQFEGVYKFLRARISTIVVGGTVTVTYEGS